MMFARLMFEALALLLSSVRSPMLGINWVSKVFAAEARYLGPFLHTDNTYNKELERRIKSLNIVFNMRGRFWVANGIPIKIKAQFFKGLLSPQISCCRVRTFYKQYRVSSVPEDSSYAPRTRLRSQR